MEEKKRHKSIVIEDVKYITHLTKKFEQRKKWEKPDPRHIKAFIPGTVEEVFVKETESCKKGEVLLILKAMKMHNKLLMPFSGAIKKVYVKKGQLVMKDELMIELE